jgi:adenylate cyclase
VDWLRGHVRPWNLGLVIGLLLVAAQVFGGTTGFLYQLELKAVDARLRFRGPQPPDPRIAIIAIDARSIDAYGQWPWRRDLVGELVKRASDAGAAAIALDIVFSEPARSGPEEDEALARLLRQSRKVVLGFIFVLEGEELETRASGAGPVEAIQGAAINVAQGARGGFQIASAARVDPNIDVIAAACPNQGFFAISPDADGVVRFYYSLLEYEGSYYPSLALKALQLYYDEYLELRPYQRVLPRVLLGKQEIRNDEEGRILLNYRGKGRETFPTIPAADLLAGRVDPAALEGRIVFIGITEIGVSDIRATPLDPSTPGVEVHATAADNVLSGDYLHRTFASDLWDILILLVLCTGVGWLRSRLQSPLLGAAVIVALLAGFAVANYLAFTRLAVWMFVVGPVVGAVLSYTAAEVYQDFFAEEKARLIRKTFQQVVSPVVVQEMLRDPERVRLGGERKELTVLFSDIRGFTSLSEKLPPEVVLEILNEYLTPMTRVIFEQHGTFDKYIGDAIMAIWNAPLEQPDHPALACRAALGMREALGDINRRWQQTRRLPEVRIGVGINTGPMSVGYMGSEMIKSYTVLGDNVNLGSRLEGLTKHYQIDVAVSQYTWERVREEFYFRELDRVRVAGKKDAVTVFQLVDLHDRLGNRRAFYEQYRRALERYRARDFRAAIEGFQAALALHPADFTTQMYVSRSTVYAAKPPGIDWDGIFTLESK